MLKYSESYPHGITLVSDSIVRKKTRANTTAFFHTIKQLVEYFIATPHELVVPIYNFQFELVGNNSYNPRSSSIIDSYPNYYNYSYDMKRLFILNEEEKSIIDLYLRRYPSKTAAGMRDEIEDSYKDYPALITFADKVKSWDAYQDRHNGNFLKDECGNYLIIDIEGFDPLHEWKTSR